MRTCVRVAALGHPARRRRYVRGEARGHDDRLRALAQLGEPALIEILGKGGGRHVHALANNVDPRPVQPNRPPRSFGAQRSLGRRRTPLAPGELDDALVRLVERIVGRMGKAGYAGRTVVLRLRFDDYSRATRSHTLPDHATTAAPILTAARALLAAAMPLIERQGLTLVGLTVANLADLRGGMQLQLPPFA